MLLFPHLQGWSLSKRGQSFLIILLLPIYCNIMDQTNNQKGEGKQETHEHHGDDGCDDCLKQRKQNEHLVDFYTRLHNIQSKVNQLKGPVTNHSSIHSTQSSTISAISSKIAQPVPSTIMTHDHKEMGYELATALIERELKMKLENQRLKAIIDKMNKQKIEKDQRRIMQSSNLSEKKSNVSDGEQVKFRQSKQSRYSDALDALPQSPTTFFSSSTPKSPKFFSSQPKSYWDIGSAFSNQQETSFSNFPSVNAHSKPSGLLNKSQLSGKTTIRQKQDNISTKYSKLNLWLYQYKPEQIDDHPIKSLRRGKSKIGRK